MCNPALAVMAVMTAVTVVGQQEQARAQAKAYNAQEQQTLNEGAYREDAARAQAERIRKAGTAQQGAANAQLAASGVKIGEGSALEVTKQIGQDAEQDALSAILSGKRAADSASFEANMLGNAGENAVTSANYKSSATVLSSASKMYGSWQSGGGAGG